MSDTAHQELASDIVRDTARRYLASRRERIDAFVDRHFTLAGSLALHRRAIGWDLLRAPANLFLAGPALALGLAGSTARRAGCKRLATWLSRRHSLFKTDIAREIEWLVATELLEIPFHRHGRASYRDAIAEMIVGNDRAAHRLAGPLATMAESDPEFCSRLAAAVESCIGSRTAISEITTGFVAAGRIASPEMFPEAGMLPHLICSRPMFIGGANDEADQHGGA